MALVSIDENLAPMQGLTSASIKMSGFDVISGGARIRFEIRDETKTRIGEMSFDVVPQPAGTVDAMIAEAHLRLRDVLRHWLFDVAQAHTQVSGRGQGL